MAQGAPKQASAWSVFANPKGVTPGVRSSAFGEKWAESIGEQMADARARRALKASFKVKKTGGEDERDPIKEAFDRSALIGGALGALTAGGATALESRMPVNDLLRSHIAEKEKDYTQNKSFSKAMSIAQQKAMLAASDVVHNHPVASTALAALSGFGTGAALGPQVMKTLQLRKGA